MEVLVHQSRMWMTIKGIIEFGIRQHQPLNQRNAEKMMDVKVLNSLA